MKAIRVGQFGGPEVMFLAEVPVPEPGAGQVLLRIHAAGVNPVETYIRSGTYPIQPSLPYTPGSDAAGLVEAVGDGVVEFTPGDRVYAAGTLSGSYAEFALCNVSQVHRLPENVGYSQGAALGVPYATAYRSLFQRGQGIAGEKVLVHGASGGVGMAAVQLAVSYGLEVWGTAGTDQGRELVLAQGAAGVFDHGAAGYLEQIIQSTGGVNLILEMLANRNLGNDLKLLRPFGRVIVIGSRGQVEIDPRDALSRDADIRGVALLNTPPSDIQKIHAGLFDGLKNATLRPIIGREFQLADAVQAHIAVMQPGAVGKIVLLVA